MSDGYTKQPRAKNVFSLVTRGNQVQGMKPHCQQHAVLFSSPFVADMLCDLLGAIHWIPQVSQWCISMNANNICYLREFCLLSVHNF